MESKTKAFFKELLEVMLWGALGGAITAGLPIVQSWVGEYPALIILASIFKALNQLIKQRTGSYKPLGAAYRKLGSPLGR